MAAHRTTHRFPDIEPDPSVSTTIRHGNGHRPVCNAMTVLLRRAGSVTGNLAHRLAFCGALARSAALSVTLSCAGLAAVAGLAGCVDTAIRTAPFRTRPDAAEPGSLQGPFNGRVVDATTHAPIAGALIYAAWTFERGTALAEPAGAREFVGSTDAAGNYKVPPARQAARRHAGHRVHAAGLQARLHRLSQRPAVQRSRPADGLRADRQPGAARALAQRALARAPPAVRRRRAPRSPRSPSGSSPTPAPSSTAGGPGTAMTCGPAGARASTSSRPSC